MLLKCEAKNGVTAPRTETDGIQLFITFSALSFLMIVGARYLHIFSLIYHIFRGCIRTSVVRTMDSMTSLELPSLSKNHRSTLA